MLPHPAGARLYMLTWRTGEMHVFLASSLERLFSVPFHTTGGQVRVCVTLCNTVSMSAFAFAYAPETAISRVSASTPPSLTRC